MVMVAITSYYVGANEGARTGYILGVAESILNQQKAFENMIKRIRERAR